MMDNARPVQWYPGHMAKAKRKLKEDLKLVDIAAELRDARIPAGSANPAIQSLLNGKPRVILLNKCDLADPNQTSRWVSSCEREGVKAIPVDCKSGKGIPAFYRAVQETLREQIDAWQKRGMTGRPIRIMVVGVPNVGKSSFINRLLLKSGAGKAEVRDRPGVTRQNRWFTVGKGFELLDTPGVLWPKFEDPAVGERLAFTGAVKDEILDLEGLACSFLEVLTKLYPNAVKERYRIELSSSPMEGHQLLALIAKKRGMLVSGGELDTERAAITVLDEFRAGKLGRITLEWA